MQSKMVDASFKPPIASGLSDISYKNPHSLESDHISCKSIVILHNPAHKYVNKQLRTLDMTFEMEKEAWHRIPAYRGEMACGTVRKLWQRELVVSDTFRVPQRSLGKIQPSEHWPCGTFCEADKWLVTRCSCLCNVCSLCER